MSHVHAKPWTWHPLGRERLPGLAEEVIVFDPFSEFGFPVVGLPASVISSPEVTVKFLVEQLVTSGHIQPKDADRLVSQVLHRESLGSTGIGRGVAIPHTTSGAVTSVLGVVGRSEEPVTWPGAVDNEPVRTVYLLVAPAGNPGTSVRALEAILRQIRGG
jgi:mannitol/fructose-specific phosphotransferase system IIA component (Ntr-type)